MQNNDRKPEIRFSGFEAGWKKKCFGDEFDILSNNTLSRDFLNYEEGIAKNVHYGDVLIKFNEYLDASKEVLPYIEDERVIDKFQNSFLRDGDIVIADTAEDETVGKCTEIGNIRDLPIIAGLHTMPCRPKEKYAPMYLGYYLNANAYHRELLPLMQGVKVTSISRSGVKDTDIIVSEEYDEQKKIGQYLFTLDEKIKFEQDKLDRLIILKKSMLEKMFPQGNSKVPEIRFGKYTDGWEQRKLGEVLLLLKDGTHGTHVDVEDGPLLLSAKNIKNGEVNWDDTDRRISQKDYNAIHSKFCLQTGDILLTIVGSIGETAILKDASDITFQRSVAFLRPSIEIKSQFLYSEIQTAKFKKELNDRKSTSAQPGIYLGDLSVIPVVFPKNNEEQKQIGTFFKNIDNLITFHQRKVDKLKNIKSSCMDKMFV